MGLYTVKEVASFLKISTITLYRLAESRKIGFKKVGGQLRFTKRDLADYLGMLASEIQIDEA
jgi:excisionase family DNA binding protein